MISHLSQSCETNMYADDTEIDFASKPDCPEELENNLNGDLCKISQYFNINRLSLNVPKCEFMLMGRYQSLAKMPEMAIHINNKPLHKVTISKYFGAIHKCQHFHKSTNHTLSETTFPTHLPPKRVHINIFEFQKSPWK